MPIPSRAVRNVSRGELQWLTFIFNRPRMLLRVSWPERILWTIVTVLRSLHWLPISKRIAYKVLSLTSQYPRETAPRYLHEPTLHFVDSVKTQRKSTCGFSENTNKNHPGARSFRSAAPTLWNRLPNTAQYTRCWHFGGSWNFICFRLFCHLPAFSSPAPDLFFHSTYCIPLLTVTSLHCSPPTPPLSLHNYVCVLCRSCI